VKVNEKGKQNASGVKGARISHEWQQSSARQMILGWSRQVAKVSRTVRVDEEISSIEGKREKENVMGE
jgi:transposase-like protein